MLQLTTQSEESSKRRGTNRLGEIPYNKIRQRNNGCAQNCTKLKQKMFLIKYLQL